MNPLSRDPSAGSYTGLLEGLAICLSLIPILSACVSTTPTHGQPEVSAALRERTGHELPASEEAAATPLPPGINLVDGLTQDEAVAVALWTNPTFRADLAQLGFAHADLAEAGLLQNPVLSLFFPWGPKQLEATLRWPLEALWLRPKRVSIAHLDVERVASSLVESGLTLASEVKIAYADLLLARDSADLAEESMRLQREIAHLTRARLRAGDVSELETGLVAVAALEAAQESARALHRVISARERLESLLGIDSDDLLLQADPLSEAEGAPGADSPTAGGSPDRARDRGPAARQIPELDLLLADALAARPDVRAAELAVEAAGRRIGLAESEYWQITAVLDANEEGREGFEAGPGLDFVIPLFDRNQGGISRAEAELQRAAAQYLAVRSEVSLAVHVAYEQYLEAFEALQVWRDEIVPALEEASQRTERALELGQVSYLDLVVARLALIRAKQQAAAVTAELHRARARLEKAVGRSIPNDPSTYRHGQ